MHVLDGNQGVDPPNEIDIEGIIFAQRFTQGMSQIIHGGAVPESGRETPGQSLVYEKAAKDQGLDQPKERHANGNGHASFDDFGW